MDLATLGGLVALALIDSTSIGTLLIPIWLMLAPSAAQRGAIPLYLLAITIFYFLIGVVLLAGARLVIAELEAVFDTPPVIWGQLALGVAFFALSFVLVRRPGKDPAAPSPWPGRISRAVSSPAGVVGLAVVAGMLELATMLPYLGALALMTGAGLAWPALLGVLALYCLVMILPAVALLVARNVAAPWLDPRLGRLSDWLGRNLAGATSWVVGILGFFLAIDAVGRLDVFS